MFLSIKEMEVRRVRFDETFQPGEIDFSSEDVKQSSPLHAAGVAELLANTDGEVRIQGRLTVKLESECDRCLGRAEFPLDTRFDLFYRPSQSLNTAEEVAIDEGEAEIGFYEVAGWSWKIFFGSRSCCCCPCSVSVRRSAEESAPCVGRTAMKVLVTAGRSR